MSAGTSVSGLQEQRCEYVRHACYRPRFQTYKYCAVHILEDETSPFTACEYISRSSKRKCPNPALRQRKISSAPTFCHDHLRNLIAREKLQKQRKRQKKKKRTQQHLDENPVEKQRNKWIDQLAKYCSDTVEGQGSQQYVSSDSEREEVHRPITDGWLLENSEDTKNDADWDDFDAVNNEVYEPLRYAEALTPEEVVATTQSKLIRLQSLYIEQFKRLFYQLKESRREYLHARKKEDKDLRSGKVPLSNIYATDLTEEEVQGLLNHRKRSGADALLRKRQKRRRIEASGESSHFQSDANPPRCSHTKNQCRCHKYCLPYTKYCSEHILDDPHQLLYKKCHIETCKTPLCPLVNRPHKIVEKGEGAEPKQEDILYCTLHAPLSQMTFNFDLVQKTNEDVDVKIEDDKDLTSLGTAESGPCQKDEEMEDEDVVVVDDIPHEPVPTGSDLNNPVSEQQSTSLITDLGCQETENIARNSMEELEIGSATCQETGNSNCKENSIGGKIDDARDGLEEESFKEDLQTSPVLTSECEPTAMEVDANEPPFPTPTSAITTPEVAEAPLVMDASTTLAAEPPQEGTELKGRVETHTESPSIQTDSVTPGTQDTPLPEPPKQDSKSEVDPSNVFQPIMPDNKESQTSSVQHQEERDSELPQEPPPIPDKPPIDPKEGPPTGESQNMAPNTEPDTAELDKKDLLPSVISPPATVDCAISGVNDPPTSNLQTSQEKIDPVEKDSGKSGGESNENDATVRKDDVGHNETSSPIETPVVDKAYMPISPARLLTIDAQSLDVKLASEGKSYSAERQPSSASESLRTGMFECRSGDRKPSSADEEMAIVSLLSLRTGHPSDETHSSSTDVE